VITLDFTQSRCPIPLVQTKLHVKQADHGEQFYLLLSDHGSIADVPKFLKKLGHDVVLVEQNADNGHKYKITLIE